MRKKSRNPAAPKRQNRLLTLSAALLLLPAAAWSTDISTVKFGTSPGTTTATVEADTLPTDPIGGTNGGILVKDATNQLTHSPDTALYGASNGNTVNVDGDVKTNESTYYTVVGGTTVNQAGDSSGNTVNVTAANASTIIGSTNNGSVVGGIAAYLKAAEGSDVPTYTPGKATGNTVTLTAGTSNTITVNKDLIGGSSTHSDATGNTVTIHGATAGVSISGNVYGGAADSLTEDPPNPATTGNANENTVTIDGKVTLSKPVRGGGTYHGNADGNTVSYDGTEGSVVADITGGSTNIGNANGNTVKIKGVGTITSATGGSTYTGDAKDNTVEIGGAVTITENVRGGTTGSGGGTAAGNVTGNHVTIGGTAIITENIDGGYSAKGNVSDNHVTFEASTLGKEVHGGNAVSGDVFDNTVSAKITGTALDNNTHIIGGESNNGAVYGNTVEITGVEAGTTNTTNKVIYGGYIYNGSSDVTVNKTISDNHVTVKNVIASGAAIRGGEADIHAAKTGSSVDVSNNSVTLSGKSFAPTVYGGNTDLGNATGNSVSIDTTITNTFTTVTGGVATGNASANEVTLSNQGTFTTVTGGNATTATATDADNNKVTIAGKAPASDGPYVLTVGSVTGGKTVSTAATASASGNKLTVANATISAITGGDATSAGSASDNIIELDKANVTGAITGGLSKTLAQGNAITIKNAEVGVVTGGQTTDGNANDNHVTITDSTISGAIIGGDAHTATTASSGSANGNVIELDNVKIVSKITGGYGKTLAQGNTITIKNAEVGAVTGGQTVDGDVIDNHVTIINSTITGNVYAGQPGNLATDKATGNSVTLENVKIDSSDAAITVSAAQIAADNATGDATGNTVTLAGKIELSGSNNVSLKSVNVTGSSPVNDAYTGNTLEVRDYEAVGTKVFSEISGFENYNFYFENVPLGSDPVLEATEVKLDNAAGTKNAQVKLSLAGQAATLKLGDQVQLFHETAGGEISGASAATLSITQGATLQYSGSLDANGALNVTSVSTTPSSKALSEGALAGVALLTQGADLAVDKGIAAALRATSTPGLSGFAAVGGGSLRYDTGSHVQVDGFSLLAGLSFGTALAPGKLTVGAFFEYGSGDYDTSNSFATGKIKGSGDTEYTGGGLLARLDFTGTEAGHFYGEATGRLGKVESDFSSAGLQNQATKYDAEGAYYGLHLGAGYVWKLSGQSELDVYGKYLWSHQKGDSVRLNTGDPVEFDDVNSHRLRLGARLNWQAGERFSPYAGLAYEQELDGEAKATAYGQAIEAPDLKGGTAIGEFGLSFQAGEAVTLDLGVQGYTGKRDGVTGSLKLKVAF